MLPLWICLSLLSLTSAIPTGSVEATIHSSPSLRPTPSPPTAPGFNSKEQADLDSVISKAEASLSLSSASNHVSASSSSTAPSATSTPVDCDDGSWDLTIPNYQKFETDQNLRTWWFGGKGTDGIIYPAQKSDLTQSLALDFQPVGHSFLCTLESHSCQPADTCDLFAVHLGNGPPGDPSHWAWFATHSISNLWAFGTSFYNGVTNAGIYTADLNLDLTKVFTKPSKNPEILTKDLLLGFSFVVVAAFNFVPVVGQVADAAEAATLATAIGSTAGLTISTGGSFLGNVLASGTTDLSTKAADFGAYMATVFDSTQRGVDNFIDQLMGGVNIGGPAGGTPTILDILNGGAWVNDNVLKNSQTDIASITTLLQKDFIQRGINHIWAQSKIWVSFVDLQDGPAQTRCLADRNGWQASKTCLHGGVYYLYRFNEQGNEAGTLDYPWGADQMSSAPWNLSPAWVTHSSGMAYRAQNNGAGGFNYDYSKAPTNLPDLLQAVAKQGSFDNLNALEGVWNISVCDMGTHADWNNDFTSAEPFNPQWSPYGTMAFPCCCGPQCSQTKEFIASAQMNNFDTIYNSCKTQLAKCDAWPAGATQVDFGDAGVIVKQDPQGDTCVY